MITKELKKYIKENGLKYTFVAKKLGISRTHLSLVLNQKSNASDSLEKKMADVMK